jgi:prepilin-type N-terminal cleavage/methylation domain-containing protein
MADCKCKRGFTLVEMLVVLGVIATLAAMVIVVIRRVENQSNESVVANAFALLKGALREYYEYTDGFPAQPDRTPSNATALAHIQFMYSALDAVPASRQILKGIDNILVQRHDSQSALARFYDPWGTPLNYVYASGIDTFPELTSAGPDRKFGTADDISSKGK